MTAAPSLGIAPPARRRRESEPESAAIARDSAERSVLSGIMIANAVPADVLSMLMPEMFLRESHQLLYRGMCDLTARGVPVDPVTLQANMNGELARAGGMEYIADLVDVVPTAAHIAHHARIVCEHAQRRALEKAGHELAAAAVDPSVKVSELTARMAQLATSTLTGDLATPVPSLRELLEDPDASKPPAPAVTRLAWAGRVVCIAGGEGIGKTTLVGAGAAGHTIGATFLDGQAHEPGRVLWVNLEEHRADVVRRMVRFGADPDRCFVQERLGEAPLAAILSAIAQRAPTVVVIDSINVLASLCGVVDGGQAAQWLPVLRPLEQAARQSGTAMVWIAQAKKSDGSYRDSTAIGHSADVVLELPAPEAGSARRRIRIKKTRFDLTDFTVELVGDVYQVVAIGELSIDAKVFQYILAHPRYSKRAIRDGVGARAGDADAAIARLVASGAIRNVGTTSHHNYQATSPAGEEEGTSELPF